MGSVPCGKATQILTIMDHLHAKKNHYEMASRDFSIKQKLQILFMPSTHNNWKHLLITNTLQRIQQLVK